MESWQKIKFGNDAIFIYMETNELINLINDSKSHSKARFDYKRYVLSVEMVFKRKGLRWHLFK